VDIHRAIYNMFLDEMGEKKDNKLHALSIHTKTEDDWTKVEESPDCVFKKPQV
jgi:stress-induced morphogen